MNRQDPCPSTWSLERFLVHEPLDAALSEHIRSCDACQAELERRRDVGQTYLASDAATLLRKRASGRSRGRQFAPWAGAVSLAAAALGGVWMLRPESQSSIQSEFAVKGSSQLQLLLVTGDVAEPLRGDRVAPGQVLQARIQATDHGYASLLVIEDRNQVSVLVASLEYGPGVTALGPSFSPDRSEGSYELWLCTRSNAFDPRALVARLFSASPAPSTLLRQECVTTAHQAFEVRRP